MRAELLLIDPNNDFCEKGPIVENIPGEKITQLAPENNNLSHMPYQGSLYVPGADEDMIRVASMIKRVMWRLKDIHVTLDSHHRFSIFHPCFILDRNNQHPDPFTQILHKDVVDGIYRATVPGLQQWLFDYTKTLEEKGRYPYVIWPYHCIIGTPGAAIYPEVLDALLEWETKPGIVDKVTKGSNYKTEHYSAVQAEVVDPEDKGTLLNTKLIKTLEKADLLAIAGEASSHCVANTVTDIADKFGDDAVKNIVILTDAMSTVLGFEHLHDAFMADMRSRGVQFSTTTEFLA